MKEVLVGSNVPFHHATLKGLSFFAWLFSVQFSWASKKDLFYVRKLLVFFPSFFFSLLLYCATMEEKEGRNMIKVLA